MKPIPDIVWGGQIIQGSREKPNITGLKKLSNKLWLVMRFRYTHRSELYLAFIRETPSCSRWEQRQRPTARHYSESEWEALEYTALHAMPPSNPSARSSRNPAEEETECRTGRDGGHQENKPKSTGDECVLCPTSFPIFNLINSLNINI